MTDDPIERAILEARRVAATEGAEQLRKASKGTFGVWTRADEDALRRGVVSIWNENRGRSEELRINTPEHRATLERLTEARTMLLAGTEEARARCGDMSLRRDVG